MSILSNLSRNISYKKDNLPKIYHTIGEKTETMVGKALEDVDRVSNFLSSPKGLLFLSKQTGLQLTNPKTESKSGLLNKLKVQNTRIFNPIKFAANISSHVTGLHLSRHGGFNDTTYEKIVQKRNQDGESRIVRVYNELYGNVTPKTNKVRSFLNKIRDTISPLQGKTLITTLSGLAGPKSIFGFGWTNHYKYPSGIDINTVDLPSFEPKGNFYNYVDTYRSLIDTEYSNNNNRLIIITDKNYKKDQLVPGEKSSPRETISNIIATKETIEYNNLKEKKKKFTDIYNIPNRKDYSQLVSGKYKDTNIYKKYNLPDTGEGEIDKIYGDVNNNDVDDFIKLKFSYVNDLSDSIQFRSTIVGLSRKVGASWNAVKYIGRAESLSSYEGPELKTIDFSFIVVANSKSEMDVIYEKLNKLENMTEPEYDSFGRIIPPIIKLRLGNIVKNEPGFLTSVTYTFDDSYPWDLDLEVPMYINVDVSFTIIGKVTPKKGIIYFGHITN